MRRGVPALGRWKMLDNLRRSLSPPAAVAALVAGWTLPLPESTEWTVFILLTFLLPTLLPVFAAVVPRMARVSVSSHFRVLSEDLGIAVSRTFFFKGFGDHQALHSFPTRRSSD